ncbi:MAG: hypothetical protein AB1721_03145 [Patescibacteria group bacterium]
MKTPEMGGSYPEKTKSDLVISRAEKYIDQGNLKGAVISIGSDINDDPTIDGIQKKIIVSLSMEYQSKPNLSRDDVDTFIDYVKKLLE